MSHHGARATAEVHARIVDETFEPVGDSGHINSQFVEPPSDASPACLNTTQSNITTLHNNDSIDDVDVARMEEYALLSVLLRCAPNTALLQDLSRLRGNSTPLGNAHTALGDAAAKADPVRLEREFFELFIGVGRGELLPYGSYYITGFLHERPLARLRDDLRALGVVRAEGQSEPEDHAAILCEIMAGLSGGAFAAPQSAQNKFFGRHLAPWIGRFFTDLEHARSAPFYRQVGTIGRLFVAIEAEAFALSS